MAAKNQQNAIETRARQREVTLTDREQAVESAQQATALQQQEHETRATKRETAVIERERSVREQEKAVRGKNATLKQQSCAQNELIRQERATLTKEQQSLKTQQECAQRTDALQQQMLGELQMKERQLATQQLDIAAAHEELEKQKKEYEEMQQAQKADKLQLLNNIEQLISTSNSLKEEVATLTDEEARLHELMETRQAHVRQCHAASEELHTRAQAQKLEIGIQAQLISAHRATVAQLEEAILERERLNQEFEVNREAKIRENERLKEENRKLVQEHEEIIQKRREANALLELEVRGLESRRQELQTEIIALQVIVRGHGAVIAAGPPPAPPGYQPKNDDDANDGLQLPPYMARPAARPVVARLARLN
jgi:hypothetical protein